MMEPKKIAEALVKELDVHWLVMMDVNKKPLTEEFEKILYSYLKPECTMKHHNDDGTLIEYLGQQKPCSDCPIMQECFDIFYAYKKRSRRNASGERLTRRVREDMKAQQRIDALEALKKDLQTRFISSGNSWSKGRNSGLIECCNIIDKAIALLREGERG